MASNNASEGSPRISTSTPTDQPSKVPPEEDEFEWEYEYSTTETETFYVTLDLSKADFTSRDASTVNRPGYRGGEKVERAKMYLNRRMSFGNNNNNNNSNNNNIDLSSDSSPDSDVEEMAQVPKPKEPRPRSQPAPEPKDAGEDLDNDDDHQVQIMELHSQNPVISYKGRIYSGVWSANVGTELLLTRRDEDAPLPALRHLDHDVELLAASSARVTVKEIDLKPKEEDDDEGALERRRNALLPRERSALSSLVPPAERWSTRERIDQGNFLARLIALKKEKGETDEVTVIAKGVERPDKSKDKAKRLRKGKQGHRGKFNLPHGRGPRRAKGSGILRTLAIHENGGEGEGEEGENEMALGSAGSGVSTPTPRRWDDLGGQTGGEGDEEEGEVEGGDGEDDEVMVVDDLNEEGENEDESEGDSDEEDEDSGSSGSGSDDSAEGMDLDEI